VRRHGTISPFIHTHTILCLKIKGSLSYCSPSPFSASRVSTHHPSPARARHRLRVHSLGCAFPASRHALQQNSREKPGPSGKAGIPRSKLAGRHSNWKRIKDSDKRLIYLQRGRSRGRLDVWLSRCVECPRVCRLGKEPVEWHALAQPCSRTSQPCPGTWDGVSDGITYITLPKQESKPHTHKRSLASSL
jgi:hypothetical protein